MALDVKNPVLILLIFATFLDILALSIPYWFVIGDNNAGIWGLCGASGCIQYILTSRVLHMFGLIDGIVAIIFYIIAENKDFLDLKKRTILIAVLSFAAGALILAADCYMANSLMLCPACLAMSLIAALCFFFAGGRLIASLSSSD